MANGKWQMAGGVGHRRLDAQFSRVACPPDQNDMVVRAGRMSHVAFTIHHSPRKGQALTESIIALGALTVGFLGVMGLLSRSLSASRVTADQYTGSYLASEGIEIVKNLIDAGTIRGLPWGGGFAEGDYEVDYLTDWDAHSPGDYKGISLRYDPDAHLYSYAGTEETRFVRRVSIARPSSDEIAVKSKVTWTTRGGGTFEADVEDHFYHWRE